MAQAILYTPHPNQLKIHNSIKNDNHKYYVINIGRQFGKTLLGINQMLDWALNNQQVKIGWVSPVYRQSKKVFEETVKAFIKKPKIYKNVNRSELIIEYATGSTIQFFSAERYDNIRGNTFDFLICDEFAFMDEKAWSEVLRATVLVNGKKVLLISTPKGKNHFFNLYQLDGINPQYKSFSMTSYDNPIINPTEIDDARATLPDHVFRQEYMAEFIDGGASLFVNMKWQQGEITEKCFAGIDVGRADDYTVLSIFNERGEMFFCERWRQMEWSAIVKHIGNAIRRYRCSTTMEINSIGDVVFEMLQKEIGSEFFLDSFLTTSKSKQDIIERLIVANQNNEVSFMPHNWLQKEFEVFTYEYNAKTRNVRYSAPNGFHDDGIMATAIGFECYLKHKSGWGYNF